MTEVAARGVVTLLLLCAPVRAEGRAAEPANEKASRAPDRVGRRPDAARTLWHDDPVIQQALAIVGQPVNPVAVADPEEIRLLYARLPGIGAPPRGLDAFRAPGDASDPQIYVNRNSPIYRRAAAAPSILAVLKLAATLVHEQVHNTDGESAACRLQADFVRSRMSGVPWRQRAEARHYLEGLDARARALAARD